MRRVSAWRRAGPGNMEEGLGESGGEWVEAGGRREEEEETRREVWEGVGG